jgi:hypothetical protein
VEIGGRWEVVDGGVDAALVAGVSVRESRLVGARRAEIAELCAERRLVAGPVAGSVADRVRRELRRQEVEARLAAAGGEGRCSD